MTEKELEEIDARASKAKKNRTEYLISAALGKEITVINDLREMLVQLKKIGNNLNQLTRKAKGRLFATPQERKYLVSKYSLIKFLAGR